LDNDDVQLEKGSNLETLKPFYTSFFYKKLLDCLTSVVGKKCNFQLDFGVAIALFFTNHMVATSRRTRVTKA